MVLSLVDQAVDSATLHAYTAVVAFISGLCVVVSTLQYVARYGYLFFVPARPPPQEPPK